MDFSRLEPSDLRTPCPYKGVTSAYWSVRMGEQLHRDRAWSYDVPTRQLAPIAGLVAFYDEQVDVVVDASDRTGRVRTSSREPVALQRHRSSSRRVALGSLRRVGEARPHRGVAEHLL